MKAIHTPTPWYLGSMLVDPGVEGWDGTIQSGPDAIEIAAATAAGVNPEPYEIAEVYSEANAEHIVRCVNSHADLLAACVAVYGQLNHLRGFGGDEGIMRRLCDQIEAAIAKAKGV